MTLLVDDYDVAYFVDRLGFALVADEAAVADGGTPKRWVVVRPGDGGAGLLLAVADDDDQAAAVGQQTGGRVGFFWHVDDFAATHGRLLDAGVEFAESPRHEPYGTVAVFADYLGNRWDLLGPSPSS